MSDEINKVEQERQSLVAAGKKGTLATLKAYVGLSGPGWLQSALTLGGGSLGSSLYLGILAGTSLLWLQPFAMIIGVVMMSAIAYVTLSTGERPFRAINNHINPVLGWSWLIAALMANMVWSLPQYSLCFAVCEQNFFPSIFMGDGILAPGPDGSNFGKYLVSGVILFISTIITWSYGSGHWGVKLYDQTLKVVVAVIVLSFIGVVARMSLVGNGIDWASVAGGFIPNPNHFFEPVASLKPLLDQITDPAARQFWSDIIVSEQRDVMISAGAAAVGINMTFLLPYLLLTRGWGKEFRGLTIFDLSTGTFIPFVLATGCIVIASATQFHGKLPEGFVMTANNIEVPKKFQGPFEGILEKRDAAATNGDYAIQGDADLGEKQVAAALVRRDTFDLAASLERLFDPTGQGGGRFLANIVFGVGVVAMTLSSISLMMLISGFVVCEVLDRPVSGWTFRLGCMASAVGVFWPLLWDGDAKAWLTVIAGVYGAMLLPIAYITFFFMMNQKSLLGEEMVKGKLRYVWNALMLLSVIAAVAAGVSAIYKKIGYEGLYVLAAYVALVLIVQFMKPKAEAINHS